jgi:hypothetical protein
MFAISAWTRSGSVRPASCRGRAPLTVPSSSTPDQQHPAGPVGQAHHRLDEVAVVQPLPPLALELDLIGLPTSDPPRDTRRQVRCRLQWRLHAPYSFCAGLCNTFTSLSLCAYNFAHPRITASSPSPWASRRYAAPRWPPPSPARRPIPCAMTMRKHQQRRGSHRSGCGSSRTGTWKRACGQSRRGQPIRTENAAALAASAATGRDGPVSYGPVTAEHVAPLPSAYVSAWTPPQP